MAGGAGPALIALAAAPAATGAQGLRAGVVYEGTIRIDGNAATLLVGGQALTLKTALSFLDGQRVQAQLVRTPEGLQVRITLPGGDAAKPNIPAPPLPAAPGNTAAAPKPQPLPNPLPSAPNAAGLASAANKPMTLPNAQAPANAPTAGSAPPPTMTDAAQLARVAAEVARSMPQGLEAGRFAGLLPRQLPANDSLVRAAMQVLAARNATGADLAAVGRTMAAAAERGVIRPETAGFVLAFQVSDGGEPEAWLGALRRWVEAAAKPLEARLAAALRGGAEQGRALDLGQDLRSVLMQARADEGIARMLRQDGDLDSFRQALDRTIDRLTGTQAQNLRAFDGPYLFAELPAGERFERAHLHILGDGAAQGKPGSPRQVVLDVSLRRLGDLWLALSVSGPRCQCTVRVANPEMLPEVANAADELAGALRDAGFPSAEVRVMGWDGDRVAALAGVLATRDRLDLEA